MSAHLSPTLGHTIIHVAAGARAVKPPEHKPWGQVVGYVRDLNGCLVEICSPVSSS